MSESLAISWTAARCISSSLDTLSLEDKDFSHCCTLSILKNFILVSSWLKMLYQHQVYSEVIHWYIYMCLFSFNFFSHLGYHRILNRVPWAVQWGLAGYLSYIYSSECMLITNSGFISYIYSSVCMLITNSGFISPHLFPQTISMFFISGSMFLFCK